MGVLFFAVVVCVHFPLMRCLVLFDFSTNNTKAKKQIEELMKSKLISAEGQIRSNERKILEEIEERAIDLSIEKVRAKLSKSLSGNDYDKHFDASIQSIEKGLMQVYS